MAPSGRLELRDRMYPSSALQDCAWLLCRVNLSQPLVLSGAPSHCLSSDLSAVPVFIFHSFEKHLLSTFHAPSNWLGAESTPGVLLHTLPPPLRKRIHTQSPGPGLIHPSPASQSSMWSPPPSPENAYSGLLLLRGGISDWAEQPFLFSSSLSPFISGILSGSHNTPIQIL